MDGDETENEDYMLIKKVQDEYKLKTITEAGRLVGMDSSYIYKIRNGQKLSNMTKIRIWDVLRYKEATAILNMLGLKTFQNNLLNIARNRVASKKDDDNQED